jgi:hypothetical protein
MFNRNVRTLRFLSTHLLGDELIGGRHSVSAQQNNFNVLCLAIQPRLSALTMIWRLQAYLLRWQHNMVE